VSEPTDIVIVGGGLAGLRAAQMLVGDGFSVRLVEASDALGGRVRSRNVDGYVIDEGFQLINPSYPEIVASGVLPALDLRSFAPVIRFCDGATFHQVADPRYSLISGIRSLQHPHLSLRDGLAFARLLLRARFSSISRLTRGADYATMDGLLAEGLSDSMINGVLQPFLRGTLLDEALETSWHYSELLLKSFASGRPGVPSRGASALPNALLAASPGLLVHYNEPAIAVDGTSVTTAQGRHEARAVLVATDQTSAANLVGSPDLGWRTQTAYWFATPRLDETNQFRIDAVRGLWNTLDITAVAPERAPAGRSLIAASAVGDVDDPRVASDVARLYDLDERDVVLIERQVVRHALPVIARPLELNTPARRGDLFVAGDYTQTPSIQGAMVSGRRAAAAIRAALSA